MKVLVMIVAALALSGCARVHYANCATFGTDCDTLSPSELARANEAHAQQQASTASQPTDNAYNHIIQCSLSGGRWDGSTCYHAPAPVFIPVQPSTIHVLVN